MKKNIIIVCLIVAFIAVMIYINYAVGNKEQTYMSNKSSGTQSTNEQNMPEIKKAPDFELKNLAGETVKLSNYIGKKVFINFFATWCQPCTMEMPYINEINKEGHDIEILIINKAETKSKVDSYIQAAGYSFNVLLDEKNEVSSKYSVYSIPTSILVDESGNIVNKYTGTMSKEQLLKFMKLK